MNKSFAFLFLLWIQIFSIDWMNPSIEDFKSLEENLMNSTYMYLPDLIFYRKNHPPYDGRVRSYKEFKFSQDDQFDKDVNIVSIGKNTKKIAICTYFSSNYFKKNQGIQYFINMRINELKKVFFDGDYVYQVGGYPNIAEGDLVLHETPYAFKISMIRRLQRLGYSKILWLDAIINIKRNLDPFWERLNSNPIFVPPSIWRFRLYCPNHVKEATELSCQGARKVTHFESGILGLNLADPSIQDLMIQWYDLALLKYPFFSYFPEQMPLSILIYKNNIVVNSNDWRNYFHYDYEPIITDVDDTTG